MAASSKPSLWKTSSVIFLLVLCTLIACGPSAPQVYECQSVAVRAIKKNLAFPSTFDTHGLLTSEKAHDLAVIRGDEEYGWTIRAPVIFGVKNAFGVQSDYMVWYDGTVNQEGNCTGVRLGDFAPYYR